MSGRERQLWTEFVRQREERNDEKQTRKRRAKKGPEPTPAELEAGVGRSHHRGDAIRLALAGVSATLGTIHLIAAGGVERLAAGAHYALAVYLSHVLSPPARLVFGFLWSFLQPAGNGMLQTLNEAVVHAKEPLERPSTRDLVTGLIMSVSDPTVHMRRSTDGPAAAGGHTMSPMEATGRNGFGEPTSVGGELARSGRGGSNEASRPATRVLSRGTRRDAGRTAATG